MGGLANIAERGAQEELAALRAAWNPLLIDEGRRLVYALQLLHRVETVLEISACEIDTVAGILRRGGPAPPGRPLGVQEGGNALTPQRHIRRKF